MTAANTLPTYLRRFFGEHLPGERNLARNTRIAYRDALALLLRFAAQETGKPVDRLDFNDLGAERLLRFLDHLETERGCSVRTRNQRLGALRAFARYSATRRPDLVEWCSQVRAIPLKKAAPKAVAYLEKPDLDALLEVPDLSQPQGRRDHALLAFLYNSGARASEAAGLTVGDLNMDGAGRGRALAKVRGKGGKTRYCPLWPPVTEELAALAEGRSAREHVFLNCRGKALTRSGIHQAVKRCAGQVPTLAGRAIGPHVLRHTFATHMLRSGVDINTVRACLGHASLETTLVYAETDVETKAKAVASCDAQAPGPVHPWKRDKGLMDYLNSL
ncbi:MAG: tyrosine-type recombinase/integrase [Bryobacterales bacterium]|nr:tyrosine-type recombinase/integrase [Bryobacterales bacterium]